MKLNKSSYSQIPILLIGFNRLEYLNDRLEELVSIAPEIVYVSIDYKSKNQIAEFTEKLDIVKSKWPTDCELLVDIKSANLGLAKHITSEITKILKKHKALIIVEDDIRISSEFINFARFSLSESGFDSQYASVGGFSVLPSARKNPFLNYSRNSRYFYCWGWGTTSKVWEKYQLVLESENLERRLNQSSIWNQLNNEQKNTWLGRFSKVSINPLKTWDIQFQYMSFCENLEHLVPLFRVTENCGFEDERSSNTREKRPWWLGPINHFYPKPVVKQLRSSFNRIMNFIESISLVGDLTKTVGLLRKLSQLVRRKTNTF